MKLYIGVTKDNELYYIDWDKPYNEQRKTFSLSGGTYANPTTEEQGEQNARETLSDSSYYEDLGYLGNIPNFLTQFINFNDVAEYFINNDGWENINGEFEHFGEHENQEIYLSFSSYGQHQEKRNDLKKLFIGENDFKTINDFWNKEHLKPLKEKTLKKMEEIFNHYEKKGLCSDQEVLIKYLNFIKW